MNRSSSIKRRIEIPAKQKDYYLIDLISTQTCATNDPLVIQNIITEVWLSGVMVNGAKKARMERLLEI